jgi:hypothetical protein
MADITAADFMQNRVTNPNQSEIYRQRLYDYQLYATAGITTLTFFQSAVGQGITTALGAAAVEVHLTLSRHSVGPDVPASLTPEEFGQMVDGIRAVEASLRTTPDKDAAVAEMGEMRRIFGRSVRGRWRIMARLPQRVAERMRHGCISGAAAVLVQCESRLRVGW